MSTASAEAYNRHVPSLGAHSDRNHVHIDMTEAHAGRRVRSHRSHHHQLRSSRKPLVLITFLMLVVVLVLLAAVYLLQLHRLTDTAKEGDGGSYKQCCEEGRKYRNVVEQQQQQETAGGCSREGREEGGSAVVAQEESHKISVCGSVLEAQQRMPWLRIVIPTISRQQEMDYLTPTIQALHTETARSSLYSDPSNVQIVVINHNLPPLRHEAFERLKQHPTLGARSSWNLVRFVESRPKTRNTKNRLLQQTNDFLWTLKYMLQQQQQQQNSVDAGNRQKEEETREKKLAESYVLLMEDDFTLCPHGLRSLHYMIDKSTSYFPNWIGLRVSYGLNGVVIKSSDLPDLIQFYESVIREHTQRGKKLEPPDHLIYRYLHTMQQDNRQKIGARQLVAYRYNLFRHIGVSSTFTGRYTRYNPECYQVLYDWLQPYERFRNEDCPNDDISPCQPQQEQKSEPAIESFTHSLIDWDVKATQLCRLHFPLCAEKSGITTQEQALAHGCRLRNDRQ